ncbi:MAG: TIGR03560 family F420-dependent LLM class oxidoreductase [Chloroflexota bacterium]|nr:TIGR03560 family F420-dependent LLM class oxidoreductase [Chloroflexota bacterium]
MSSPIHFGIQLHPQYVSWDEMREFGLLVDELGYDSLMTWDHFVPLSGDPTGPNLEGWQVLAAWAAITKQTRIAMLVTGNTYRHPAVLANMAATLDHISGGRSILGLGASWHEAEHRMYGIPFDTVPIRLARLREASRIVRSLLEQERTTFQGKHYTITDARCGPKPIQKRLPLLIGGGGEQVTLRITARYADMWHGFGTPAVIARKIAILKRHCAEVGRDYAEILPTTGGGMLVRDTEDGVTKRLATVRERSRMSASPALPLPGIPTVEAVAQRLAEHWRAGARGFVFGMSPPYDRETIERLIGEVRPRLQEIIG